MSLYDNAGLKFHHPMKADQARSAVERAGVLCTVLYLGFALWSLPGGSNAFSPQV